jgi:hypothetical protein
MPTLTQTLSKLLIAGFHLRRCGYYENTKIEGKQVIFVELSAVNM